MTAADDALESVLRARGVTGGLLAAGGWCVPSETLFPFDNSIPEVEMPRAKRGGIKFDELPSAEYMAQRNMERLIHEAITDALNKQLAEEEVIAAGAIAAGCGYAVIGDGPTRSVSIDDNSYSIRQTWQYFILQNWPRVERLEFPSFDAYEEWTAIPLEQRLREIDEFKAAEEEL